MWTNIAVLVEKMDCFDKENEAPSYLNIFSDIIKANYKN